MAIPLPVPLLHDKGQPEPSLCPLAHTHGEPSWLRKVEENAIFRRAVCRADHIFTAEN